MKQGIHPEYMDCVVKCSCGNTFTTKSTKPELRVDICNACHPFYTGQQKLIDTGGRVQRFSDRFGSAKDVVAEREAAKKAERAAQVAEREAKAAAKAERAAAFAAEAAKSAALEESAVEAERGAAETASEAAAVEDAATGDNVHESLDAEAAVTGEPAEEISTEA